MSEPTLTIPPYHNHSFVIGRPIPRNSVSIHLGKLRHSLVYWFVSGGRRMVRFQIPYDKLHRMLTPAVGESSSPVPPSLVVVSKHPE